MIEVNRSRNSTLEAYFKAFLLPQYAHTVPPQSLAPDIRPVMHSLELNLSHSPIRALDRAPQIVAAGRHPEHPPARGLDTVPSQSRSRMKHCCACGLRLLDALNRNTR